MINAIERDDNNNRMMSMGMKLPMHPRLRLEGEQAAYLDPKHLHQISPLMEVWMHTTASRSFDISQNFVSLTCLEGQYFTSVK